MTQTDPIEIIEQLKTTNSVPEMARLVRLLLNHCNIYNLQLIGNELSRIAVTSGLGTN